MTKTMLHSLGLVFLWHASSVAGALSNLTLANSFDASESVPGITIGGVYFDGQSNELVLAGGTDNSGGGRLRIFTTSGSLVQQVNIAGAIRVGGIAGSPTSDDLIAVEELTFSQTASATRIYRLARDGTIIDRRVLDNSFVANGIYAGAVAINPQTGNIWVAESIGTHDNLYELDAEFNLVRRVSTAFLGVNIIGLDIDPHSGHFLATDGSGLVEINADLSTVLSSFPLNSIVASPTSVSIDPNGHRLFVSSGFTDEVYEFTGYSIPEPATLSLMLVGYLSSIARRKGAVDRMGAAIRLQLLRIS